jgi:dimethylaniline monooxygenase (N-oxide forming)
MASPRKDEDFDFVAVCTGQFSDKNVPVFSGEDGFRANGGEVMHSSEYTDPATLKGKDVLVLGFSKSATDIAVNAVNAGAKSVNIVYRESVWRIPYFIGGLINFKRILYVRAQENMFPAWAQTRMQKIQPCDRKAFHLGQLAGARKPAVDPVQVRQDGPAP